MDIQLITKSKIVGLNKNGARGTEDPTHILAVMGKPETLPGLNAGEALRGYRIPYGYFFVELDAEGFIVPGTKRKCLGYNSFRDITFEEADLLESAILAQNPPVADLPHGHRMNILFTTGFTIEMATTFEEALTNIKSYVEKPVVIPGDKLKSK